MSSVSGLLEWWRFFRVAAPLLFLTQLAGVVVGLALMGPSGLFGLPLVWVVMVSGLVLWMSGTNVVATLVQDLPSMVGLARLPDKAARLAQDKKVLPLVLTMLLTLLVLFHYLEATFTAGQEWFDGVLAKAGTELPEFLPVLDKDALGESHALMNLVLAMFLVNMVVPALTAIWTRKSVPRPIPSWKAITLAWGMWASIVSMALLVGCVWGLGLHLASPRLEGSVSSLGYPWAAAQQAYVKTGSDVHLLEAKAGIDAKLRQMRAARPWIGPFIPTSADISAQRYCMLWARHLGKEDLAPCFSMKNGSDEVSTPFQMRAAIKRYETVFAAKSG